MMYIRPAGMKILPQDRQIIRLSCIAPARKLTAARKHAMINRENSSEV